MYSEPSCESRSALPAGRRSGAPFPASPPCAASSGLLAALLRRAAHAASLPRRLHPLLPRARKPLNPAPCTLGSCTLGSCTLWTCTLHPCTLQLCNPAALQPAPYISVPPRLRAPALHSLSSPLPWVRRGPQFHPLCHGDEILPPRPCGVPEPVWAAAPCPITGCVPRVSSPQPACPHTGEHWLTARSRTGQKAERGNCRKDVLSQQSPRGIN